MSPHQKIDNEQQLKSYKTTDENKFSHMVSPRIVRQLVVVACNFVFLLAHVVLNARQEAVFLEAASRDARTGEVNHAMNPTALTQHIDMLMSIEAREVLAVLAEIFD